MLAGMTRHWCKKRNGLVGAKILKRHKQPVLRQPKQSSMRKHMLPK